MPTDKKILMRGLRYLSGALPLLFLGPVVIHNSFMNKEHPFFKMVLGVGITFCVIAILLMFKGIRTIMKSLVD
ncbi:DUF6095 family protein [Flavobacterium sp. MFBS3-15]|mgnify:CR=1 FL=1|uniref:DUF6095 family protein n=1 Tax=Flavobacterium sp. MFBS3-15 TaxID=2989816 RepID=UPI0022358F2D|nr:DUF6095 family protein [Flavobacterium sp. MFBS3-15]MCW4467801.1 DUF6095 family protein [Flavobacterium sp. MFBS3-15]